MKNASTTPKENSAEALKTYGVYRVQDCTDSSDCLNAMEIINDMATVYGYGWTGVLIRRYNALRSLKAKFEAKGK